MKKKNTHTVRMNSKKTRRRETIPLSIIIEKPKWKGIDDKRKWWKKKLKWNSLETQNYLLLRFSLSLSLLFLQIIDIYINNSFCTVHFVLKFAELSFQKWGSNSTKELCIDIHRYFSFSSVSPSLTTSKSVSLSYAYKYSSRYLFLIFFCCCCYWTHWNTEQLIVIVVVVAVAVADVWFFKCIFEVFHSVCGIRSARFLCLPTKFFLNRFNSHTTYTYFIWLKRWNDVGKMEKEEKKTMKKREKKSTERKMLVIILWADIRLHVHNFDRMHFSGNLKKRRSKKQKRYQNEKNTYLSLSLCVFSFALLCLRFSVPTMAIITCTQIPSCFIRYLFQFFPLYIDL